MFGSEATRRQLQSELAQSRVIGRSRAKGVPVEFALCRRNRQIVDRRNAAAHQPALVEFPILVAIGAEPVAGIVTPFISEPYCDPIAGEGPQLLDQTVL